MHAISDRLAGFGVQRLPFMPVYLFKTNFYLLMLERFWIECHTANPLTPKILLIILLTACQIILIMLV